MCVFSRSKFLFHSFYNVQRDFLYLKTLFIAYHQVRSSSCMYGIKCGACCSAITESLCVFSFVSLIIVLSDSAIFSFYLFVFISISRAINVSGLRCCYHNNCDRAPAFFTFFGCEQILLLSGILEQHNLEC